MEQGDLTNEITAIDLKGKVYSINEFDVENQRRYFLDDGTPVNRMSDALFQIAGTQIILRILLTP